MTDAWEMHQAETGLNPGPVWRDRGIIIANLTARNQALEERVAELELAALNLRDNTQGAHEELAESRAEIKRLRKVSLKRLQGWHDMRDRVEAAEDATHYFRDIVAPGWQARAETAEAETQALRERLTAVEAVRQGWVDGWEPVHHKGYIADLDRALAASPAVDATPEPTPAVQRVRAYVVAHDEFYGREAGDEDLLDDAKYLIDPAAPSVPLLFSDLRALVGAPGPEAYDDRLDPTPAAEPQAEGGVPDYARFLPSENCPVCRGRDVRCATCRLAPRPAPVADPSGDPNGDNQ